jgi:hypothetical protein
MRTWVHRELVARWVPSGATANRAHNRHSTSRWPKHAALYFSMTVTTTGFGDIVAVARYARDIVTAQMFITLIVLAAAIRGVTSAAQLGSHRRGDGGEGGGGAGAGADVAESVETTGSDSASPSGSD